MSLPAPNLIRSGVNGYVVDTEDSEALAGRLVRALTLSGEKWKEMSDAAVTGEHAWDNAVRLFECALIGADGQKATVRRPRDAHA